MLFIKDLDTTLKSIVDHQWDKAELDAFYTLMPMKVKGLKAIGHAQYEICDSEMTMFCARKVKVKVGSLEDEYEWRLEIKAMMAAIGSGQIDQLPYEKWCFSRNDICDAFGAFDNVPENLLKRIRSYREAILEFIGSPPYTIKGILADIRKHARDIKKLSRAATCDIEWMEHHLTDLVTKKLQAMVWKCFPDDETKDDFSVSKASQPFNIGTGLKRLFSKCRRTVGRNGNRIYTSYQGASPDAKCGCVWRYVPTRASVLAKPSFETFRNITWLRCVRRPPRLCTPSPKQRSIARQWSSGARSTAPTVC